MSPGLDANTFYCGLAGKGQNAGACQQVDKQRAEKGRFIPQTVAHERRRSQRAWQWAPLAGKGAQAIEGRMFQAPSGKGDSRKRTA